MVDLEQRKRIADEWKEISKMAADDAKNESEELRNTLTIIFGGAGAGGIYLANKDISSFWLDTVLLTTIASSVFGVYHHMREKQLCKTFADFANKKGKEAQKDQSNLSYNLPNYYDEKKKFSIDYKSNILLQRAFILRAAVVTACITAAGAIFQEELTPPPYPINSRNENELREFNLFQEPEVMAP